MLNDISFEPLKEDHIPVITQWFNEPHVVEFYSLRNNWTAEQTFKKLIPYIKQEKPVKCFIILNNNLAIGLIQMYPVKAFPWPEQDLPEEIIEQAAGIDILIGEKEFLRKGFGTSIIKQFLDEYVWKTFDYCVVDPDIKNTAMIRCNEKLGFKKHKIIQSKDLLGRLVQLKLMILKKSGLTKHNKIIKWATDYLSTHGYALESNVPEVIQETPWSYVIRFKTTDDYLYLKQMPEFIAMEGTIIQVLRDQFAASVVCLIANNPALNCFLMKNAGQSLRSLLKQKFDESLLYKTIDQFTSLQIAVADRVDLFLDMGVPDWRLEKLPDLYKKLISKKDLLTADGLTEVEIIQLENLAPLLSHLCKNLSSHAIKQTMVQPDFNDNNTLIDDQSQKITIIDLGEIAISHPFFSVINFLQVIKNHHGLKEEEQTYLKMKNVCIKNFEKYESKKNIVDAFEIACVLFHVYSALASHRLVMACGEEKFTGEFKRQKRISFSLKQFMNACITIAKR